MGLFWLVYTVAYVVFFYVFQDASEIADVNIDGYLEVILLGVPSVVLLAGTLWLRESTRDRDIGPRMIGWTVGMTGLFVVAMYTAVFVIETRFDPGEQWLILLFSIGFGASAGTVVGLLDIQSKQRERERERSRQLARRRERERDQLEYLNQFLRHEVLNEATKIISHAELLETRSEIDLDGVDSVGTIHDSGREIAAFVESIRTILDASDHDPDLDQIEVRSVLQEEANTCQQHFPTVSIDIECPADVTAVSGNLLNRVFRNLFENAIEHNGRDVSLSVSVSVDGDWVAVTVRDDGAGIPDADREPLFEPPTSGDHGYGLFLTRTLVEVYGGRLELAETGPEGTEFVVRLPAVPDTTDSSRTAPKRTGRPITQ